jgi:uncharacterized membrane protein
VARTVNLLSDGNALLRFSSSDGANIGISSVSYDWEADNATLSISGNDFIVNTRYVLIAAPNDSDDIVIRLPAIPLNIADNGRVLSANMRLKVNSPVIVDALLYIDSASASYSAVSQSYTSGLYSAVHTNQVSVPDDGNVHTATIQITVSGHSTNPVHMTMPHIIHDMAIFENPFVRRSRTFLPDFYFEIDSAQTQPSYPFFRLVDILTSAAGETVLEHDRMYGVEVGQVQLPEQTAEYWARSTLVSPRSVRDNYIPWLAQFTGGPLRQNIQKTDVKIRFISALACYILLVSGLYYFIIRKNAPVKDAFLLGVLINGVYETTNYALLSKWSMLTVILDTLWGGVLFAVTTYLTRLLRFIIKK